ncbi:DUF5796 family protein [Halomicroarcula sp. GCM10025324]|uniref:DUF5796 family protein n=1 Tax=Haloarcula TaxID=2237 RepID=UPI0023E8409B|nr:DUF5796 family protein [Halomicroarcula sp. ZS-22-S1]
MSNRSDIAPSSLSVELTEDGVAVEYLDGRTAFYHGIPSKVEERVRTAPGKDTHVLITDETETTGILVYVNDLRTHDDIIEESGVGRVILQNGDEDELFPGVTVRDHQMRVEVEVDFDVADGRVFVFEEDDMGERSFEIVPEEV